MGTKYSKARSNESEVGKDKKKSNENTKRDDGLQKDIAYEEEKSEESSKLNRPLTPDNLIKKAKSYIHQGMDINLSNLLTWLVLLLIFHAGNLMFRESKYDVARNRYSLALSLLRGGYVDDNTHIATILNNLGIMEYAEGR